MIFFAALTGLVVFVLMGGLGPEWAAFKDKMKDKEGPMMTEADFREKLTEIKMRRGQAENAIERLQRRQDANVAYLKEKGVRKVADAKDDPDLKMALFNLKNCKADMDKLKGELSSYDEAISRLDGMVRKLEREQISESAGLTEDQQVELRSIVLNLDDQLNLNENDIFEDAEIDDMLDDALGIDSEEEKGTLDETENMLDGLLK